MSRITSAPTTVAGTVCVQLKVELTRQPEQNATYRLVACAPPLAPRVADRATAMRVERIVAETAFTSWPEFASALFASGYPLPDIEVLRSMLAHRNAAVIGRFTLQGDDWARLGFSDLQKDEAQPGGIPVPTLSAPERKESR